MRPRRAGDAIDVVGPVRDLADVVGLDMAHDIGVVPEVAADPAGPVHAARDHDAVLVDDLHDDAQRVSLDPERILEMFEQRADGDDRAQAARLIVNRPPDRDDPRVEGAHEQHVADCQAFAGKHLLEKVALGGVRPVDFGTGRGPDVVSLEIEYHDVGDVIRQLGLHTTQQRIIGGGVGRIPGHRTTEPGPQIVQVADVLVHLACEQPRLDEGEPYGGGVINAPLIPEADANERNEGDGGRNDQAQHSHSNAAQQHRQSPSILMRWPISLAIFLCSPVQTRSSIAESLYKFNQDLMVWDVVGLPPAAGARRSADICSTGQDRPRFSWWEEGLAAWRRRWRLRARGLQWSSSSRPRSSRKSAPASSSAPMCSGCSTSWA